MSKKDKKDGHILPHAIYFIVFPNGKLYIGKTTTSLEDRWDLHVKKRKCPAAYDAIHSFLKEGLKMLMIQVRQCYSKLEADEYEARYIKTHKSLITENGYNFTKGGDGGVLVGDAIERHKQACLNREYRKPKEPTSASASDIENAIHWVQMMNLDMSKRLTAIIAGELLGVSRATIEDHMKRIGMVFEDARRICTDDQIDDALTWVMSQEFASMMNKTLVEELVGNQFGSDREIMRKYLKRHNITLEGLDNKRGPGQHTEEAKQTIGASKIGKKKSEEEIERRTETRRNKKIEEYALAGIDIRDENLERVLVDTGYKVRTSARIISGDREEFLNGIRCILRTYILTRT
ncbi:GIY-YIG catalytic domain-containing endonuclease [Paramecium bursaria Chlorella virus CvsA1]|nr:GIY-YIG catalytic domain-containing endonuclease [Paramecium bursaria Chlorella virus CvsA1]